MNRTFTRDDYEAAAAAIRERAPGIEPRIGAVLGSGMGSLIEALDEAVIIPYADLPNWPQSTVQGHSGRLHVGTLAGHPIMMMQGRLHFYEGYSMTEVTFPMRVMQAMGVQTLIVTNAAGGLNTAWEIGDLMLIRDHINFIGLAGFNPLYGPNNDDLGPRFLNMTDAYNGELRDLALTIAEEQGVTLRQGVYVGVSGPTFETPAEVRMLRACGADAVGMSTVAEVTVARHAGIRVLGFSGISNIAIDTVDSDAVTDHEEVLEAGKVYAPKLARLIRGILERMK
jgi:purine-nucleoside phosphorylase